MKNSIFFSLTLIIIMLMSEASISTSMEVDKPPFKNTLVNTNVTKTKSTSYNINTFLKDIDKAYKPYSSKTVKKVDCSFWCTAAVDAGGALGGAASGLQICLGFWVCGVVGAIIGGGAASIAVHSSQLIAIAPQQNYGTSNNNNWYDAVGQLHNQILYNAYLRPNYYWSSSLGSPVDTLNLPRLYNLMDSLYRLSPIDSTNDSISGHFSQAQFDTLVKYVQSPRSNISCLLTESYNAGTIDKNTQYILAKYVSDVSNLSNNSDIQRFTVATENMVDTSSLSMNKQLIFQTLTVYKNSYAFWSANY